MDFMVPFLAGVACGICGYFLGKRLVAQIKTDMESGEL